MLKKSFCFSIFKISNKGYQRLQSVQIFPLIILEDKGMKAYLIFPKLFRLKNLIFFLKIFFMGKSTYI